MPLSTNYLHTLETEAKVAHEKYLKLRMEAETQRGVWEQAARAYRDGLSDVLKNLSGRAFADPLPDYLNVW